MTYNENIISMFSAYSVVRYPEGLQDQIASVQVLVNNLAYDKRVAIHLKDAKGQWVDTPLSYAGPACNGFELWRGSTGKVGTPLDPLEFAAKVTMNGQTYWDDHGSANYRLRASQGTRLFGTQVLNASGSLSGGDFSVEVDVQNLGFQKRVQVVYTTDGWATVRTADASYLSIYVTPGGYGSVPSPNAYGVERWQSNVRAISASRVEYAIAYTVNGQTHWDNCFGRNYQLTLQ